MSPAVVVLPLLMVALGAAVQAAAGAGRHRTVAERLASGSSSGGGWARRLPAAPPWLETAVGDAAVDVPPQTVWAGWLAAILVTALVAAAVAGVAVAVLAVVAVVAVPLVALRARRGEADRRVEKELPLALEAVARSLRSGASVRQAIAEAAAAPSGGDGKRGRGRLPTELATVADQAGHGAGLIEALEALAVRRPGPGVRLAVAALCLGVDTGGAQARAVDGVAATMRERLAVEAEVRALSSQARMSALVIGLAPLGFGAFAAATDPRTSEFLLHTPVGLALLTAGLLLDGAGWLWMQRLCRVTT
jgi:tight adherence protein B